MNKQLATEYLKEVDYKSPVDWMAKLAMYTSLARSIASRIGDGYAENGGAEDDDNPLKRYLRMAGEAMDARQLPPGMTWAQHKEVCIANPPERCPYMPKSERAKIKKARAESDKSDVLSSGVDPSRPETVNLGFVEMPKFLVSDMMERDEAREADPEWKANYEQLRDAVSSDIQVYSDTLSYVPDESASFLKKNAAYNQGSIDFVDICLKRELTLQMLSDIMREEPDLVFTAKDIQTIIDQLHKAHNENPKDAKYIDWACAACFVEHARQHLGEVIKGFHDAISGRPDPEMKEKQRALLAGLERSIGKDRLREIAEETTLRDLAIPEAYSEYRKRGPEYDAVYKAWVKFNSIRGSGREQLFDLPSMYKGEYKLGAKIRKDGDKNGKKVDEKYVREANDLGGIRFWSKSDFDPRFLKDILDIVRDASESGFKAQAYTKRDDFAYLMKDTGIKILRSGIPKGKGYEECTKDTPYAVEVDGKYYRLIFDADEGIDFNDPNVMDSSAHHDIGCNIIGVNDLQMRIAQKDPRICQIIPLHGNKTPEGLQRMKDQYGWDKPGQDGESLLIGYTNKGKPKYKAKGHLNFYKAVINRMEEEGKEITEKSFCEAYLDVCRKKGVIPRCPYGLDRELDKDGKPAFWPPRKEDRKNGVPGQPKYKYKPGYSKYLMDGKFFEYGEQGFGKYYPQNPMRAVFDRNAIRQVLANRDYEVRTRRNLPLGKYREEALRQIREAHGIKR